MNDSETYEEMLEWFLGLSDEQRYAIDNWLLMFTTAWNEAQDIRQGMDGEEGN